MNTYSVDTETGDLYENGDCVGKLITGTSGAYFRLIEQANKAAELQARISELESAVAR